MESFFEAITETQKTSLEAAASFTDTYLIVVERIAQLNIEVARAAFEKSSEMALLWAAQHFFCKNFQAIPSGWKSQSFRLR